MKMFSSSYYTNLKGHPIRTTAKKLELLALDMNKYSPVLVRRLRGLLRVVKLFKVAKVVKV